MIIIPTSKPQNYYDYTGTPDKVIKPSNKDLVKGSEVKFNIFSGWVEYPVYKDLSEVDSSKCNKKGIIYLYHPAHTRSDKFGMLKYKLIGITKKKSDKRVLLVVEDMDKKAIFKHVYFQLIEGKMVDCGHVYPKTKENWESCEIGGEYKGHRSAKWIKLDPKDYMDLTGKAYEPGDFLENIIK